jgi:RNA polymerase-binding transcription factor DksA
LPSTVSEDFYMPFIHTERELFRSPALVARNDAASRLASEGDRIRATLGTRITVNVETRDSGDIRDLVTDDSTREVELRHRHALIDRLRLIGEAATRLDAGTFGRCVECGEAIAPRRLESDPAAPLCVDCQSLCEESLMAPSL